MTDQSRQTVTHRYYEQMDGLRFISIFFVLLQHFITMRVGQYAALGRAGVELFFVISGFLISEGLFVLKDKYDFSKSIKVFYSRRILRIFPLYYFYWAILLIFFYAQVSDHKWWGLLYGVNFYSIYHGTPNFTGHLWSLSVEEQFYLAWPMIILLVPNKYMAKVIGFFIVLSFLFIVFNLNNPHIDYTYLHTICCSISLFTGVLLAYLKKEGLLTAGLLRKFFWPAIVVPFVILIIPAAAKLGYLDAKYNIAIRLCICILGIYWVGRAAVNPFTKRWGAFLQNRFIQKVGQISYGIYIYHWLTYDLLKPYVEESFGRLTSSDIFLNPVLRYIKYNPTFFCFPVYFMAVFAVAWLSYHLLETRFLALKKYFA